MKTPNGEPQIQRSRNTMGHEDTGTYVSTYPWGSLRGIPVRALVFNTPRLGKVPTGQSALGWQAPS